MPERLRLAAVGLMCLALVVPACAQKPGKPDYQPQVGQPGKDVVWVPTPDEVVEKMLDMAQVTAKDRVVDLGSGDGKIAIAAAKRGARAKGIEYNPQMVQLSRRKAQEAGAKVEFVHGDIFKVDFSDADVITMYLLPSLNAKLAPTLMAMKPGTRVTSHQFLMGDWEPDETATVGARQAHLWIVPAKLQGQWQLRLGDEPPVTLRLEQHYQKLSGEADWAGHKAPIADAKVRGTRVSFTLTDATGGAHRFEGTADARGRLAGTLAAQADGRKHSVTATRR